MVWIRRVGARAFTWRPAAGNLHVELDCVHTQDGVTDVAEQVASGNHPGKRWQLGQFLKLLFPSAQLRH